MDHQAPLFFLSLLSWLVFSFPLAAQEAGGPYRMTAGSMKPTLLPGDTVIALKYSESNSPKPDDILVFRHPKDNYVFLKRLIGMPGDRIQIVDGQLHMNGQPVKRHRIDEYLEKDGNSFTRIKRWRETLPNGVMYETLDFIENGFFDNTPIYVVPPDHCFVLGDNRDNSTDSRLLSQFGYVPLANIIGRGERR
jgi:signal peptidase I